MLNFYKLTNLQIFLHFQLKIEKIYHFQFYNFTILINCTECTFYCNLGNYKFRIFLLNCANYAK
ncbi:hypothetical protein SBRV1_gp60 [Sulfolobales Beppu rod-shaped virus 1]|uniref:Uncharacterized protein n=1 Tax=Sulfolobales Beppu rod-shaped virus 1 TaxID=2493121 RepID=A0A3Q8Q410_9VIRU|nr:hypothetical protein QIT32_gp01 [Sulfolobales Beppu rod-shaped virus 1]YP_010771900.1 hypothetical protein QIT32_gp60 [Sulfolobales Beppu rod-shaped virus 1]AZI75890.1 hypothetical protein SBRV1_gp01 [Sulfolobales Beppu rod-shaped virus 1]AZI75949.1 hypothetical protein SBRV1_gp60 [Sulfolobales Beppu rod-shaped virus 1]